MHGSTVVFPGSYSLLMNMSDYYLFLANPNPQYFGSIFNNISGAITDGFKRLLSARDGSVFSVPLDFETRPAQHPSQMIIEASALIVALNATEPSSYAGWYENAIAAFNSKASSAIQSLNILSPQNFKARFIAQSCSALFVPCHVRPANISFLHTPASLSCVLCRCTPLPTLQSKRSPPCAKTKQCSSSSVLRLLCSSVFLLLLICSFLLAHQRLYYKIWVRDFRSAFAMF
jgi:hypothetical protein